MIGRIVWLAVLGVIGLLIIGMQLDRQARKTPSLASSVPEPFRSSAQLPVAVYALSADNPDLALEEAERLVRRRPLPAEHLRVLAQAQFAAGAVDESTLTIQYAAQRGWRDSLAQEAMLRLALESGDKAEAARRFAALFVKQDTDDALLVELGSVILNEPGGEGRQTLTTIVGGGQRWHGHFLRRGVRVLPPDAFVEVVAAAMKSSTRFECNALKQSQSILERRDEEAAASLGEVLEQHC